MSEIKYFYLLQIFHIVCSYFIFEVQAHSQGEGNTQCVYNTGWNLGDHVRFLPITVHPLSLHHLYPSQM